LTRVIDKWNLPKAGPGMRIGLLGGSFDPPHAGHAHISEEALNRFGLDRVWWLVSPRNPLKAKKPAPLEKRLKESRKLLTHPRIEATDIEARIGTRYTANTLEALMSLYPQVTFVWLMGADNLASFHTWDRWTWIMENMRIGILARPGQRISARTSVAANRYDRYRLPGRDARLLTQSALPAWCFVNVPMVKLSSTQIRARGDWGVG